MAAEIYLHIEGIAGESNDYAHKGWIECQSIEWEVQQPRSATLSTAGGHTAERCVHRNIVIRKFSDLATPLLLQSCAAGRTLPKARFEFLRADANGERVKYFELELENVLVGEVAPEVHPGELLGEHLALKYSKVKWRYTLQRISGGASGQSVGGWDLATNRIV